MKIGKSIRSLRKEKNITLDELSRKSGVALATLSRMENDKMTGTLESHIQICKALGVSVSDLYRKLEIDNKTVGTVAMSDRVVYQVYSNKAKYELLTPKTLDKKILPLMLKITPGGETGKEQDKIGVEKFVYVVSGSMDAAIGDRKYSLKTGDSLFFDASLPHSFANRGKTDTEAICIVTPPRS
ncbi:MAG: XRE family transcriptional regulator [Candidatus Omnitrophota bacterium]